MIIRHVCHRHVFFFFHLLIRIQLTASPTSETIGGSVTSSSCLITFKSWLKASEEELQLSRRTPSNMKARIVFVQNEISSRATAPPISLVLLLRIVKVLMNAFVCLDFGGCEIFDLAEQGKLTKLLSAIAHVQAHRSLSFC